MANQIVFAGWCVAGHGAGPQEPGCPSCAFKVRAVRVCRDQFKATAVYADMRTVFVFKRDIATNSRALVAKVNTTVESLSHSFGLTLAAFQEWGGIWFGQLIAGPPMIPGGGQASQGHLPVIQMELVGPLGTSQDYLVAPPLVEEEGPAAAQAAQGASAPPSRSRSQAEAGIDSPTARSRSPSRRPDSPVAGPSGSQGGRRPDSPVAGPSGLCGHGGAGQPPRRLNWLDVELATLGGLANPPAAAPSPAHSSEHGSEEEEADALNEAILEPSDSSSSTSTDDSVMIISAGPEKEGG